MQLTATAISYLHICHRKLWLFARNVMMEHNSDTVHQGRVIHDSSYPQRPQKGRELAVGRIKIDHYDTENKVVHEVKKSDKLEQAHIAQVQYYLYVLHRHGIQGAQGIIEYPTLRKTTNIPALDEEDIQRVAGWEDQAARLAHSSECPPLLPKKKKNICRSCSYFEFCYSL